MTRILSTPALAGATVAALRSPDVLDGSGVGALGGTGVVDLDGVALSFSLLSPESKIVAFRRKVRSGQTLPCRHWG